MDIHYKDINFWRVKRRNEIDQHYQPATTHTTHIHFLNVSTHHANRSVDH